MQKCQHCGKELSKRQMWDRRKCCSKQCAVDLRLGKKSERIRKCQYCGKELNKQHVRGHTKYCSPQCYADSRFGEKVEWNGVWIRPVGKVLEVLKQCCAGMRPGQACQTVGAGCDAIKRLKTIPEAAKLLLKRACPVCGKDLPLPLYRKFCGKKCERKAKWVREAAAKGIPSLRRRLENAETADEWAELLRNSASTTEKSDTIILVCDRLHGSGGFGRYIGIASEQFWHGNFCDGVCVAFCNILKDSITTIEWRGENFYLTRTLKTAGAFVWPDEKLGRSIEVTRVEFDYLISLKKNRKKHVKSIKKITE